MTLIVNKYDSIINSGVHARDSKVFSALRDSSNLSFIVESVKAKSDLLEKKLRWAIEIKGLNSDRIMETLLFFLTILQCVTSLGMTYEQLSQMWWLTPLTLIAIAVTLLVRLRK